MSLYHDTRPFGSPPPFDVTPFVTRVSGRRPAWKQHTTLRNARAALAIRRYTHDAEIWLIEDGEWRLIEEKVE